MNSAKVVLITGCSSGFGRLMAETLARKHYHVFATMRAVQNRNANAAHKLRALAERESLPLHVLELDVTDDASVERAVDASSPRRVVSTSSSTTLATPSWAWPKRPRSSRPNASWKPISSASCG
jgi:NAD(P)-dependent dehydrogenase (short-subunit alcohol dehydrogenase family)